MEKITLKDLHTYIDEICDSIEDMAIYDSDYPEYAFREDQLDKFRDLMISNGDDVYEILFQIYLQCLKYHMEHPLY